MKESARIYKTKLYKPINEERKMMTSNINKSSTYRSVQIHNKVEGIKEKILTPKEKKQKDFNFEKNNQDIANKIIRDNLEFNINEIKNEIEKIEVTISGKVEEFQQLAHTLYSNI